MTRALLTSTAIAVALGAASPAHAFQCYAMFDGKNVRVLQTATAPIDLSKPIADQMAARYPGRFLEISDMGSCVEVNPAATRPAFNVLSNTSGDVDFAGTSPAGTAAPAQTPSDDTPVRRIARGARR